jgi:hypothetical protein
MPKHGNLNSNRNNQKIKVENNTTDAIQRQKQAYAILLLAPL